MFSTIWRYFSKWCSVLTQYLYYCSCLSFIQVPSEIERSSTTVKQLKDYFELKNEISRQVHKITAIIVCWYVQDLLMMQIRWLPMNGGLHVMCVEKTIRVMWNCFERFFTRFNNTHLLKFLKVYSLKFFINKYQSTKYQRKHVWHKLLKILSVQENEKELLWIIKHA